MKRDGYGFCDVWSNILNFQSRQLWVEDTSERLRIEHWLLLSSLLTYIDIYYLMLIGFYRWVIFDKFLWSCLSCFKRPWCAWLKTSAPYIKQQGKPKGYEWTKRIINLSTKGWRKQRFPMCSLRMLHACLRLCCLIFVWWESSLIAKHLFHWHAGRVAEVEQHFRPKDGEQQDHNG